MNWTPTMELRILSRPEKGGSWHEHVLQQKWIREFIYRDENLERETPHEDWRDVPTVTEE